MPRRRRAEGEQDAERQADAPIAERREDHRHARVLQAAQHAGADGLRPVDELEQRREIEEGDGEPITAAFRGSLEIEEDADQQARREEHQERRETHEADADREGGPAGARDAVRVAGAVGAADAHRDRLAEAQRHHEGQGGDLDRDRVRGERVRADAAP